MIKILNIFILSTFITFSQTSAKKIFSLAECLQTAATKNYDIIFSEAQTVAKGYELINAFGNYLPNVNFNTGYSRTLNPDGSKSVNVGGVFIETPGQNPNSYYMQAQASLTIFDGFGREARYSRVKNNLEASVENVKYVSQSVALQIYRAYIDVVKASQIVKIRREDLLQANKVLDQIKSYHQAGSIAINEIYSQEATIGEKEIEIIKSENLHKIAKAKLLTIMGLAPEIDADFQESNIPSFVSDEDIKFFRQDVGTINAAFNLAMSNRSDYKSTNFSLTAAESGVQSVRSEYYPSLTAAGGWSWNNNQFADFSTYGRSYISLNLNIPIFSNFANDYTVENAKLAYQQVEIQKYRLEQQIKTEVQNAFLNLESAEKQIEISKRAVKSAELNYESSKERYGVGSTTITELTLANTQYVTAQINRVGAFYDYILSQRELQFAIGILK